MVECHDLPLFVWSEALSRDKARRRRLAMRAALILFGIGALGATIALPPSPRLVWNASDSAPLGLYWLTPDAPVRGDMVVAWLPREARVLAARRHYLPANVPAIKRVAAGPGARICAAGATVFIDDVPAATRLRADRLGRVLPWWNGCHVLRPDEHLLLTASSRASFDGRYFGASPSSHIIGKATLLWAR